MKSILGAIVCGAVIALAVLAGGCASRDSNEQSAMRQHFVPATNTAARTSFHGGVSWSALVPLNDGTGVSRLIAHAGIGDRFPVKEPDGHCLFEVLVVAGNDSHLKIEIRTVEAARRLELVRDKSIQAQVGLSKYDFAYPSVTVAAARTEHPTTGQAMLLIHRRP